MIEIIQFLCRQLPIPLAASFAVFLILSCSSYHPLPGRDSVGSVRALEVDQPAVKVTFLGNTTVVLSDGETHLMVDGFFSRPGILPVLLGKIGPDRAEIESQLMAGGITRLDGLLVGHAHYDHALDAPLVGQLTDATVIGSPSYGKIHQGYGGDMEKLVVLDQDREVHRFGKFTVTLVLSDHASAHSFLQRAAEGSIEAPLQLPARFHELKCGKVYAIHIDHPEGSVAVTTTAGAQAGQFNGLKADVLMLGVGLISKETEEQKEFYWHETAEALGAPTIVPIHWDSFTRPLDKGLAAMPRLVDNTQASIGWVQEQQGGRHVHIMGLRDHFTLRNRKASISSLP